MVQGTAVESTLYSVVRFIFSSHAMDVFVSTHTTQLLYALSGVRRVTSGGGAGVCSVLTP